MRKLLLSAILISSLVFVLSGCGGDEPATETEPAGETPSGPADGVPTEESVLPTPGESPLPEPVPGPAGGMEISTTAFEPGGSIPVRYSCLGDNVSPDLQWSGVPAEARSLVLILYDPDAVNFGASVDIGFIHWAVFNVAPGSTGCPEDVPAGAMLADGALQGNNDFAQFEQPGAMFPGGAQVKLTGYDGPCPGEEHRYVFALYALDTFLDLPGGSVAADILAAMEGHVLAEAEVMGLFDPGS